MTSRLRALVARLDRLAQPPYEGRHTGPPAPTPIHGFAVETWVWDTWAAIAERHGIETDHG